MSQRDRISVVKDSGGITIAVKFRKQWDLLIFLPIWITGWTFAGIFVIRQLLGGDRSPIVIFWLCMWAISELLFPLIWLWNTFGREVISARDGLFVHRREVFGWGVSRSYPLDEVFHLQASGYQPVYGPFDRGFSWAHLGLAGGSVSLETKYGDTCRFGVHLDEENAVALARELAPYLRQDVDMPQPLSS